MITEISKNKIRVSPVGIALFNAQWPGSKLNSDRAYWFEFNDDHDLIDCDVPEHADELEASALADDCAEYLFGGTYPQWWVHNA